MQIFAVFGTRGHERAQIVQLAKDKYTEANVFELQSAIFVASDRETTQEVSVKLGIGDDGNNYSGVVIMVQYYWGFANPALWEWITARSRSNGH